MQRTFDVIVVGLGAMGSATLAELARRGTRVLGIDRFDPPHAKGSSHGGSRVIRQAYFEHADYVPLLLRAYEGFERLEREMRVRLKTECGVLMGGAPGNPTTAGVLRSARLHGLQVEHFDGAELMRRFPQFHVAPNWEVTFEPRGGFVRPEKVIGAALRVAERRGAQILRNMPISRWESQGSRVTVSCDAGIFEAGALVLASGAWMPELSDMSLANPFQLRPTRETIVWLRQHDTRRDDLGRTRGDAELRVDRLPVWFFDRGTAPAVYGIPSFHGMGTPRGMKVGLHACGPALPPSSLAEPVDMAMLQQTLEATQCFFPRLDLASVVDARHCMYTMSPDHHFVIGHHPKVANVVVACGCSGHGFKFAPVIGEALADFAIDGRSSLPIGFLAPRLKRLV
ncbi:MAG: N-methyl-L-tryptophan oxidase [Limnohabitans sp.]|nr:N-methyl-L-tryptophan oxidase [Limnohabitans sp.]